MLRLIFYKWKTPLVGIGQRGTGGIPTFSERERPQHNPFLVRIVGIGQRSVSDSPMIGTFVQP